MNGRGLSPQKLRKDVRKFRHLLGQCGGKKENIKRKEIKGKRKKHTHTKEGKNRQAENEALGELKQINSLN